VGLHGALASNSRRRDLHTKSDTVFPLLGLSLLWFWLTRGIDARSFGHVGRCHRLVRPVLQPGVPASIACSRAGNPRCVARTPWFVRE